MGFVRRRSRFLITNLRKLSWNPTLHDLSLIRNQQIQIRKFKIKPFALIKIGKTSFIKIDSAADILI